MSESFESPTTVSSESASHDATPVTSSEFGAVYGSAHREKTLSSSLVARALAEFMGTFFIVVVLLLTSLWTILGGGGSTYTTAIAAFAAYGIAAYTFGHVSGGHFNPAVSLAAALTQRINALQALVYIVAQVLASIAAAGVAYLLVPQITASSSAGIKTSQWWGYMMNGFAETSPTYQTTQGVLTYTMWFAIIVEFIGSLIAISAVVSAMKSNGAPTRRFAVVSGLAYAAGMFLTVPVTGGSLNPARSTGIAIIAQNNGQTSALPQLWIFWVVPLLAGAIVGLVLVISSSLKKADADVDVYTFAPEDESAAPASEEDLAEFNATIETEDAPEGATLAFEEVEETTDGETDSDADADSEDDTASEKYEQGSEEK